MSHQKSAIENLAEDICSEASSKISTIVVVLNPGFGWLDFEELSKAIRIIRPHLKLNPLALPLQ